jgi:predicted nucleotidyltransferase component of viral defense system
MRDIYLTQVKLLLRILPLLESEGTFALKGGTAINLFEQNMPRLSVDIDLTYLPFDDRATALANIKAALGRLRAKTENTMRGCTVTHVEQSDGIEAKLHCQFERAQVKIEVNTVQRGAIFATRHMSISKRTQYEFGTFSEAQILSKGELYGGKICAALDRQHPRDLFDVHHLLKSDGITEEIRIGFIAALLSHPRPIHEVLFATLKDQRQAFDSQFAGMASEPFSYDDHMAAFQNLTHVIQSSLTQSEKAFLLSFKNAEPDWTLINVPALSNLPAVKWKLENINNLKAWNPEKHKALYQALLKMFHV